MVRKDWSCEASRGYIMPEHECGKQQVQDFWTLEETENICKELEGLKRAEFEMKETVTSLKFRLMEALSMIVTLKVEVKKLYEGADTRRSTSHDRDRKITFEAPKPPIFKGAHDAQVVENILWHL